MAIDEVSKASTLEIVADNNYQINSEINSKKIQLNSV